ncbi:hypothetical protein MRX96_014889 [Rhipicephalus microplus]
MLCAALTALHDFALSATIYVAGEFLSDGSTMAGSIAPGVVHRSGGNIAKAHLFSPHLQAAVSAVDLEEPIKDPLPAIWVSYRYIYRQAASRIRHLSSSPARFSLEEWVGKKGMAAVFPSPAVRPLFTAVGIINLACLSMSSVGDRRPVVISRGKASGSKSARGWLRPEFPRMKLRLRRCVGSPVTWQE